MRYALYITIYIITETPPCAHARDFDRDGKRGGAACRMPHAAFCRVIEVARMSLREKGRIAAFPVTFLLLPCNPSL